MNAELLDPETIAIRRRMGWRLLSWLWLFPSLGAMVVLFLSIRTILQQPSSSGFPVPIDGLIAVLILLSHLTWLYLARKGTKVLPPNEAPKNS
ncbi:MAG: hypothetical protein NTV12_12675 [Verrucomicrobia bacterium]|nr:hypothetical protein [Verrucomicrobiota bacterium]